MKPTRWVVKFRADPWNWVVAGGAPKWTRERVHAETSRLLKSQYEGRFVPSHMKVKPRFYRMRGTKYFLDLRKIGKVRLAA